MNYKELAGQLMRAMYLLKKSKPKVNVTDVLQGAMFILQYLLDRNEAVLPNEISSEMEISTARIAAALNNLEQKHLIIREIDKNDRRQILVTLTAEGKELAEKHRQEVETHISQMLQSLGEHDAMEFVRILNKITSLNGNMK